MFILIAAYVATIPLANYLIVHVGTVCDPQGPCLVPVFPGVMAPSGVLVIGFALLLRDLVQRRYGKLTSLGCIFFGGFLSFAIAPPALAAASGGAFIFSELVDFAVYTPLARNYFALAILLSCTAGAVADSALFLMLAFGSLEHLFGQFLGKLYASLAYLIGRWMVAGRHYPNPNRRIVCHCWASGPCTDDGMTTTCLLPDGHKGPHSWIRDDHINVNFEGT